MGVASSPQFHQQMETFSHALQTGQLDLAQFGLQTKASEDLCFPTALLYGNVLGGGGWEGAV